MRCLGLAAALALAGCGEPTIDVSFAVPAAYRDLVGSVVLEILTPPAAEPFGCAELAFGDVPPATAALALVQQITVRGGATAVLSGIPRTGRKLFVARGYGAGELALVAACAEVDDIDDDLEVALIGEPTALGNTAPTFAGDPLPAQVRLIVTDVTGAPLPRVPVRWTTIGPAGFLVEGEGAAGAEGVIDISPAVPELPGPVGLDIQVRWQSSPIARVPGFQAPAVALAVAVPGDAPERSTLQADVLYRVGRIGPDGEMGLAALGPTTDEAAGRRILVAYRAADGFRTATSEPVFGVQALGVVRAGARDRVLAVTRVGWLEIGPDAEVTARGPPPRAGADGRRLLPLDAPDQPCTPGPAADALLVAFSDNTLGAYDAELAEIDSPFVTAAPSTRAIASGCVAGLDGTPHRTVVYVDLTRLTVMATMDRTRQGPWNVLPTGIGFSPALGGEPEGLLGLELAVDGLSVARHRLVPVGSAGLDTEAVARVDTIGFTLSSAGGDLDGDGALDLVALLPVGGENADEFRILVALGVEHLGQPLLGLSPPIPSTEAPRLFLADFDGDGTDDVLLGTPTELIVFDLSRREE